METKTTTYTRSDVGCYVDNAHGIYMVDRVVDIANDHGANIKHDCGSNTCWDDVIAQGRYEQATDYMNEHCGVDNCYWGTGDNNWGLWSGDWGLWKVTDDLS